MESVIIYSKKLVWWKITCDIKNQEALKQNEKGQSIDDNTLDDRNVSII